MRENLILVLRFYRQVTVCKLCSSAVDCIWSLFVTYHNSTAIVSDRRRGLNSYEMAARFASHPKMVLEITSNPCKVAKFNLSDAF